MTDEKRRAKIRDWQRAHPEQIRERREQRRIKTALANVASVEVLTDDVCVVKMNDGHTFTMKRERVLV